MPSSPAEPSASCVLSMSSPRPNEVSRSGRFPARHRPIPTGERSGRIPGSQIASLPQDPAPAARAAHGRVHAQLIGQQMPGPGAHLQRSAYRPTLINTVISCPASRSRVRALATTGSRSASNSSYRSASVRAARRWPRAAVRPTERSPPPPTVHPRESVNGSPRHTLNASARRPTAAPDSGASAAPEGPPVGRPAGLPQTRDARSRTGGHINQ